MWSYKPKPAATEVWRWQHVSERATAEVLRSGWRGGRRNRGLRCEVEWQLKTKPVIAGKVWWWQRTPERATTVCALQLDSTCWW